MKAEKEEIAEEPFVIRPYLKSELAHLYNPYVPLVSKEKETELVPLFRY